MKVLMVSKACVRGSYQKKLEELARFDDVDLTVIVPPYWQERGTRTPLERSHTDGYELLVEKVALNGHFHLHFYPHLAAQVTRLRPDIMHIDEEPYNLATFLAMRPAVRAGARPLFFTWQNLLRRYPFPFNLIERYNYRHAVHAIAGNREGVSVLRAKGYQGPAAVIPQFGVDPQIYKPRASRAPASSAPFRIGYVGRLVQEKGVDILIRAVAGLEGDWRLSILGEGQFAPRLEEITRELNLGDRVAFRAPLTSTEMPSHYRELDVLVLPSRTARHWKEQFGRVLIEAMACGLPVIGSDSGEIPHVMGQAGLTFPEGDIAALRLHLRRLMAVEDLRRSMAAEGRKRAVNEYAQERVAAATRQVYVDMMEARP